MQCSVTVRAFRLKTFPKSNLYVKLTQIHTFCDGQKNYRTLIIVIIWCVAFTKTSEVHARREWRVTYWLVGARARHRIGKYTLNWSSNSIITELCNNLNHCLKVWNHSSFLKKKYVSISAAWSRANGHGLYSLNCSVKTDNTFTELRKQVVLLTLVTLTIKYLNVVGAFRVCVYMSRNFLLLVAVSLLSTKRYHSLTLTCALVGFLSLHVSWTSLFGAFAHVSL